MDNQISITPRYGHQQAEMESTPHYRPARHLVTICHQHNGFNVHLRAYAQEMAEYDARVWAHRGPCEIVPRHKSIYEDVL